MFKYLVVSTRTFGVLMQTNDWIEAVRFRNSTRKLGGSVSIYKATKG